MTNSPEMAVLPTFSVLAAGMIMVALFHFGVYIPVWLSVLILFSVSIFLLGRYLDKRMGMLMIVMWLVYVLPFMHIVPYLWFDFEHDVPDLLWGLAVNPYMLDEQVIQLTAMIGAVGGLGFVLGVSLKRRRLAWTTMSTDVRAEKSLSFPLWLMWIIAGVGLSWLAAPQETIFTAAYTVSKSLLEGANFSSAWMVSYGFLIFAFCDAVLDGNRARKALKIKWVVFAIAFIVIYLQLMRGDRESLPLVLALFLIYFHWSAPPSNKSGTGLLWLKISMLGVILLAAAMIFGVLRSTVVGLDAGQFFAVLAGLRESGSIRISNMLYGTWSAALLTPLSVAGDYINGVLRLGLGKDYINFLLSMPPGFIADVFSYTRPIDGLNGPAWEMRYGIGGTHASVVPFLNFRMIGVLFVTTVWAYALHASERGALTRLTVARLAFLGMMITVSPHWLWYGEKYAMNAVLIWLLLWWCYRFCVAVEHVFTAHLVNSGKTPHPSS